MNQELLTSVGVDFEAAGSLDNTTKNENSDACFSLHEATHVPTFLADNGEHIHPTHFKLGTNQPNFGSSSNPNQQRFADYFNSDSESTSYNDIDLGFSENDEQLLYWLLSSSLSMQEHSDFWDDVANSETQSTDDYCQFSDINQGDALPRFDHDFCPPDISPLYSGSDCSSESDTYLETSVDDKTILLPLAEQTEDGSVFDEDLPTTSFIPEPVLNFASATSEQDEDLSSSTASATDNCAKSRHNSTKSFTKQTASKQKPRRRRKEQPWKDHHLWEFMRDLLENNANYSGNDVPVKWESREQRVFRIVNSQLVAKLWGLRKRNQTMNYEKLSRALRWCRSSGFLAEVPKDKNYPKKLCFRFGTRADVY